jgi:hypothetical protein
MKMEGEIFSPVSILKKTKVNEAVNRNVKRERRGVVIVEEEKDGKGGSDPDSEDSALCLKEEDNSSDISSSTSIPVLDHAPAPGNDYSKSMIH